MGITGELVRSVFSKSHNNNNVKNNVVLKKRWRRSMRAYFCGDKLLFNSVLAEEDTASVESSEASVTQPVPAETVSTVESQDFTSDQATKHDSSDHSHSLNSNLLDQDTAAVVIQSAFRGFLVRRLRTNGFGGITSEVIEGFGSPSRESLATSVEVQTGNSIGVASVQEECPSVCNKLQHKFKPSLFRQKDDWDDSTVDSSVSKMRVQNRLEATTRRERALAYAFSQQLRICTKKKPTVSDNTEPNTSWSWLERWMATRQPDILSVEDHISKQLSELSTTLKTKPIINKKFLDLSFEEKESCGSNEVPLHIIDSSANPKSGDKDRFRSSKNRLKSPRNISRRKTFPTGHYQKVKKTEGEQEKRQKIEQLGSIGVCTSDNNVSKLSADESVAVQNSGSETENSSKSIYTHVYM